MRRRLAAVLLIVVAGIAALCYHDLTRHGASADEVQAARLIIFRARTFLPAGVHLGIWSDVERCLGKTADPRAVRWTAARRIIDPRGWLPYGAAAYSADGAGVAIILDLDYVFHPTVVSHEIIHIITRDPTEDTQDMDRCVMRLPDGLPWRPVPPDTVRVYADLVGGDTASLGGTPYP